MVRDRYSGKLMPAWPGLDVKKIEEEPEDERLCSYCHAHDATRQCNQCIAESGMFVRYCFGCFELVHQRDPERRDHDFTPINAESIQQGLGKVRCGGSYDH